MSQAVVHYTQCPVCQSSTISRVMTLRDFHVSGEDFDIWECTSCRFRFTQDIPVEEAIGRYYQSEAYISHSDSQKGLVNRLYHFVRKLTLASKKNLVQKQARKTTGTLLDIGAGTGAFASCMQTHGWRVTGLEPDESARRKAREVNNISLLPSPDLFALPVSSFDVITLWHVLEHVHRLHEYVDQFARILKKEGLLFIAVPNYTSADADHYQQYWAAYDVPRHLYHFSPFAMQKLLNSHGFTVKRMEPMWFDSYYVSLLSEKYKTGRNGLLSAFWQGSLSNWKAMTRAAKCSSVIYVAVKA